MRASHPARHLPAARNELFTIKNQLSPELHLVGAKSVAVTQAILGDVRPVLFALLAAVGLLLLIACVNVGNLLLLRATSRSRELAVRRALGATYGDIVRQLLLESTLLAIAGGALGFASAAALLRILVAFAPAQLPRVDVIQVSGTPIVVAFAITGSRCSCSALDPRSSPPAATSPRRFASTLAPAATRRCAAACATCSSRRRRRSRSSCSRAACCSREASRGSRDSTSATTPITCRFSARRGRRQSSARDAQLYPLGERLVTQWRAVPGVISVTPILIPPLLGPNVFLGRLDVEGQSDADRASNPIVPVEAGNDEYFRTFGIPIARGRGFQDGDRENAQQVAVVSEAVARRFWPNQNPIGKRIHYWSGTDSTAWRTIVGVTGDVHLRSMRDATPTVYIPWRQANFWQNNMAIRTSGTLASVLPALRREMKTVEPQLNLWYAKSMDDLLAAPLAQPRMSALLMGAFAVAALLLAAIGLYGVMASVVREGTREIGIRMALGAGPERLRGEVLGRAFLVSGAGAIVGGAIALGTSRLLATLLFGVRSDRSVFARRSRRRADDRRASRRVRARAARDARRPGTSSSRGLNARAALLYHCRIARSPRSARTVSRLHRSISMSPINSRLLTLVVATSLVSSTLAAQQPNWSAVEDAFGRKGVPQTGDVMRFNFPRSDLTVSVAA